MTNKPNIRLLRRFAVAVFMAASLHALSASETARTPEAISLTSISDRVLNVAPPKVVRTENNGIVISGTVTKQPTTQRTAGTHLKVVFLDASGAVLHQEKVPYSPRELKPIVRSGNKRIGKYKLALSELPGGTAAIRVEPVSA